MTFKSEAQPLCRTCGKKIPKATETTYFSHDPNPPKTVAEAQKRTNLQIVSHSYWGEGAERHVWKIAAWDGESYADPYFCTGKCAQKMGHMAAKVGYHTQAYSKAVDKRGEHK